MGSEAEMKSWESPYRITPAVWGDLVRNLGAEDTSGVRGPIVAVGPRGPRRASGSGAINVGALSERPSAMELVLARRGLLGRDLGEGRRAVLCPQNELHSAPTESATAARGDTVLLPPREGSRMGLIRCEHSHCERMRIADWITLLGPELFADALAEVDGQRHARGYLACPDGIYVAVREGLDLPSGGGDALGAADPTQKATRAVTGGAQFDDVDGPFRWRRGAQLSNFSARIVGEVTEHTTSGVRRTFEIEAQSSGRTVKFEIPAAEFASLGWVHTRVGADATIRAGRDIRDRVREAIQLTSVPVSRRETYSITGWRRLGGQWVYLHGGGAIGAEGVVDGVEVRIANNAVARFHLPAPLDGAALIEGVQHAAALFAIQPMVTWPLFASVWRSALGGASSALYLSGSPRAGKTMLLAIAQQHFGAGLDERHLPGSWRHGTATGLLAAMGTAGDAIFGIDDYLLTGHAPADQALAAKVDAVIRGVFNGSSAVRGERDGSLAVGQSPPRSSLVATGEELPPGNSLRTRLLVLDVVQISQDLKLHKHLASEGVYAGVMASFIRWLAPRIERVRTALPDEVAAVADRFDGDPRTSTALGELAVGVKYFLEFAVEVGAMTPTQRDALRHEAWEILRKGYVAQGVHQSTQSPAPRAIELIAAALQSGRGHLTTTDGTAPDDPLRWGWRPSSSLSHTRVVDGRPDGHRVEETDVRMEPCGPRLGYLAGDLVYLIPAAALGAAKSLAQSAGDPLALSLEAFPQRLYEGGFLVRTERATRQTFTVRKRIGQSTISGLLCVRADAFQGVSAREEPDVSVPDTRTANGEIE